MSAQPLDPLADTSECGDTFKGADSLPRWAGTMLWWFNTGTKPSGLSGVAPDLRAAVTNITHEVNNCGRPDTVSATASYQGSTTLSANISSTNACLSNDGTSVVDFGTLTGWIGDTCRWNYMGSRVESDQRLNKSSYTWTTGEVCPPSGTPYYVEGISTHERGHTWNVMDFPTGHPNQTMGGANGQCPGLDDKSSLGLADMLSLEVNY